MNSKLLHHEDGRIKIDNLKNITLSDLISKKKKFKNFRDSKDNQLFNQKQKKINNLLNKYEKNSNLKQFGNNASKRMITNQINKNAKIAKLSIELFPDKPFKVKENLIKNKNKLKRNLSSRKIYPKKYFKIISELTDTNNYINRKKKRLKTFNRNKKDQSKYCKKIIERIQASNYDGGIPLMDFEKSKRKKKFLNNTLNQKEAIGKIPIKNDNLSFNQRSNYNYLNNNNIISKPQCLYKGPLKFDASSMGDDDILPQNNNQSLFKTFMSRNLKPNKNDFKEQENNKDSQACTFLKYDVNGTMRTKRIFNSTFHIDNDESNYYVNKGKKEIVATTNNCKDKGFNNKKKRTFGGIMFKLS